MVAEWDCEWEWEWQKLNQHSDFYSLSLSLSSIFFFLFVSAWGLMTAMLIALNFIFPNVTKIDEIMDEKKKKFKNQKLEFFSKKK